MNKQEREKLLIKIMKADEETGLYQTENKKGMKKVISILVLLLVFLFVQGIIYLIASFMGGTLNPFNWSMLGRIGFFIMDFPIGLIFSFLAGMFVLEFLELI